MQSESTTSRSETVSTTSLPGLACWNLRTMLCKLEVDTLGDIVVQGSAIGKLPHFLSSLIRFKIGLAAFSEHRWANKGMFTYDDWNILFSGSEAGGARGVGIAMSPEWNKAWQRALTTLARQRFTIYNTALIYT